MPKVASPSGDSSRLAPCRSRVRTPARANFSPRLKKPPSMCSPNGMALVGMARIGFFFYRRRSRCRFLLMKYGGGRFNPPLPGRIFFLIIVLYLCHNTTSYKQQHYTTDLDYLFELNTVSSIMQIYCFLHWLNLNFLLDFFTLKIVFWLKFISLYP